MSFANADAVRISRPVALRGRAIGPVAMLILAELIVFLMALNGSTFIPGDWAPFVPLMSIYLTLNALSIGVFSQNVSVPLILEGNTGRFLKVFVVFSALTWILTLLFLSQTIGGIPAPVSGTVAFQELLFIGLFVGPTEELFFRVVLPPILGKRYWTQLVLSSLAFAIFHIGAYTAAGVTWTPEVLSSQLLQVGVIGGILYAVGWKTVDSVSGTMQPRFGYPAMAGAHVAYDLSVLGVISGLGVAALTHGLVSL